MKTKRSGGKSMTTVSLASRIHPRDDVGDRWWLRGSLTKKVAEEIIQLVRDMAQGRLGDDWTAVTKSAIAQNILNLTRLNEAHRDSNECLR